MSPMWLSPRWLAPSAPNDGATASSGGSVFTPIGVKSSSVWDTPPCHEKNQLEPSVVTPCERMSASCALKVSVPTSFQQLLAALAGAAYTSATRSARRAVLRIQPGNGFDPGDLAANSREPGRAQSARRVRRRPRTRRLHCCVAAFPEGRIGRRAVERAHVPQAPVDGRALG